MIRNTLMELETKIQRSRSLNDPKKHELISLLSKLRSEIAHLSETHVDHAQSVAGFTDITTHEATRKETDSTLLKLSLDGLSASVKGFEASHPSLVKTVNEISIVLSNMGI